MNDRSSRAVLPWAFVLLTVVAFVAPVGNGVPGAAAARRGPSVALPPPTPTSTITVPTSTPTSTPTGTPTSTPTSTPTATPAPGCAGRGDANDSGAVDVADVFYLINYLFAGGPPPAP